jgi:membrane associated rhomboid family serine protease
MGESRRMFIPLTDSNRLKYIKLQYVTLGLIAVNVLVFLTLSASGYYMSSPALLGYEYIPAVINEYRVLPPDVTAPPALFTYVTYAFLHADVWHLASNMLFLWVFGDNVEDALGHFRFLIFYVSCAIAGAFAHGLMLPESEAGLVGASGATSGIVAAYLILHPRVNLWVLVLTKIPLRLPAIVPLFLWIAFQVWMLATDHASDVSWAAHVGGLAAGAILVVLLKRRDVPLFDRRIETPDAVVLEDEAARRPA